MRCLACGAKVSESALVRLAEQDVPICDAAALREGLKNVDPHISCHSCQDEPYNLLVWADEWEERREKLQEAIVEHYLLLAKAADQNASEAGNNEARKRFRKRSKKYRELAKEAR